MSRIVRCVVENYYYGERIVSRLIRSIFPSGPYPEIAVATQSHCIYQNQGAFEYEPHNALEDGFLWAVPKNRRSRERRLTRKFGSETGHRKMLPVLKLLTCDNCGHPHEPGRLCPNCYKKNKDLTTSMQEAMNSTQGLNPIEHEIIPVFQGEKVNDSEFFQGKRIVEVPKTRPQWFSRRLTQKSNVTTSDSTTVVETNNLG